MLRQASRTLPAGAAIVRPLDSVPTKPEVDTVTELVSEPLKQVAAVSSKRAEHPWRAAYRELLW